MTNETIDKLKDAGYITVTDDSQGIADKIGIPEAFPYEYVKLPDFEYILTEEKTSSEEIKIGHIDFLQTTKGLIFQTIKGISVEPIISGPSKASIKAWSAGSSEVSFYIYIQNSGSYIIGDVTINFQKRGENIPANTYYAKNIIGVLQKL